MCNDISIKMYLPLIVKGLRGIINVYAHNNATARQQLWAEMSQSPPHLGHWCNIGDFNMI